MSSYSSISITSDILRRDVLECVDDLSVSDTQRNRRTLVRAIFAEIEASLYLFRQIAANPIDREIKLAAPEIALLQEEDYEISDKGEIRLKPYFGKFLPTFRFVVQMFIKTHGLNTTIDYSGMGWDALQKAARIRNRLMHPRLPRELDVTDEEIEIVASAYNFQRDIFHGLLVERNNRMRGKLNYANARVSRAKADLHKSEVRLEETRRNCDLRLEEMRSKEEELNAVALRLETPNLSTSERENLLKDLQEKLAELQAMGKWFQDQSANLKPSSQ